jgi:hypothetical protein
VWIVKSNQRFMFDQSHAPWVFHRDEVDLLEDQIEDLYHKHQGGAQAQMTMEQEVLTEQLQTQEQSDESLTVQLGESLFESVKRSKPDSILNQHASLPFDALSMGVQRHPFYIQVRDWAAVVYVFAKERYDQGVRTRDVFRVYANVNLVPIKLSVALMEEAGESSFSREVALVEYKMANVYLMRVIDCLAHVGAQSIDDAEINTMIKIGKKLHKIIAKRAQDLENHNRRMLG